MTTSLAPSSLAPSIALCLLAASALGHSTARAQTPDGVHRVLLLVVASDTPASARRLERAFQHEVESRGLAVVVQREPEPTLGQPPIPDTCISGGCLEHRLNEAHAQLLVGLGAWLAREQPQVVLTLDDGRGPVNLTERVAPGETDAHLVARMLDRTFAGFARRGGAPLRVDGSPAGASVVIDHRPVGQLPLTVHLPIGPHVITVAHVDYLTMRQHVTLSTDGMDLSFALEPEATPAGAGEDAHDAPPTPARGRPAAPSRPIVGPVLLFVAAAGGAVGGAYGLTRGGCVEENNGGECLRRRDMPTAGIALGFGGAGVAFTAGLLWMLLGGSHADAHALNLDLGPRHAGLSLHLRY